VEDAAASLRAVDEALASGAIGAVLVEPMLGRGGVVVPPPGFLTALAERAKQAGAALVVDEIYTGLHRTGARFRAVAEGCTPDVICLGKALGGGLPVSACLIREDVARAWGASVGEAIHTSTFLGNPLACAAAMAALDVLDAPETHAEITRAAATLARVLHSTGLPVTAVGLLAAVRFGAPGRAIGVMRALLERGYVVLPGGADADALTLTPPCGVTDAQLEGFGTALRDVLAG
jgi:4-aminobutyrate aminotransferase/(S)-3-amino-2-methylpropionate transaminase